MHICVYTLPTCVPRICQLALRGRALLLSPLALALLSHARTGARPSVEHRSTDHRLEGERGATLSLTLFPDERRPFFSRGAARSVACLRLAFLPGGQRTFPKRVSLCAHQSAVFSPTGHRFWREDRALVCVLSCAAVAGNPPALHRNPRIGPFAPPGGCICSCCARSASRGGR